ncbi:cytochrome P450 [Mycolicibacterium aurum]|uniref:Cytochrome P450 n=1 Tax=Mycolicibacterium aurum TaxID=1791 RepID=A0A3S4VME2_MYCAU|nr:cytochrome P450 [Mycolicibacterium aurum]VEG54557.1 cytochrome P450 [Mycolicibacterium aurum]
MTDSVPTPAPPYAQDTGLPWDVTVDDAVAAIGDARRRHGDTFAVHSGTDRYLFTFSPAGVEAFYALPEQMASKGVADYLMLRRKLPDEIFDGRRTLPTSLFRRDDVAGYLDNLTTALDSTAAELGSEGSVELFALTRRLGHRMGLASWAGPGSAEGDAFERLVRDFDVLDGADAFVHPETMADVAASGKRAENAALEDIVDVIGSAITRHGETAGDDISLFARIVDTWSDESSARRLRGIALDVALIHIASMSNLMAALGWALVDLLTHPADGARVADGDLEWTQKCALESIRLAQRSIMARTVLEPVDLDTGAVTYRVPPGWTVATLLPLLNTSATTELGQWRPDRWQGHRLRERAGLLSPTLVTTFGHGRHSCPAQPFSLTAMSTAMTYLLGRYDMTPGWTSYPRPVAAQIGGVARAADPCAIRYCAVR